MISTNSQIHSSLRREGDKYNIGLFPSDLPFLPVLSLTEHNFFLFQLQGLRISPEYVLPDHFSLLSVYNPVVNCLEPNNLIYQIPPYLTLDFLISTTRQNEEYAIIKAVAKFLHVPHISYESKPLGNSQNVDPNLLANNFVADVNVFPDKELRQSWLIFNELNSMLARSTEEWEKVFKKASKIIYRGNK